MKTNLRLENMPERNSYEIIIAIFCSRFDFVQNYIGVNDKTYQNKLVFASCYFSDGSLHFLLHFQSARLPCREGYYFQGQNKGKHFDQT